MKKKWIAIMISVIMLFSLVACDRDSDSRETRDRRDRETTEESEEETTIETTEESTRPSRTERETEAIDDPFGDDLDDPFGDDLDDSFGDDLDDPFGDDFFSDLGIENLSAEGQRYANMLQDSGYTVFADDEMDDEVLESFFAYGPDFAMMVMYMKLPSAREASLMYDELIEEMEDELQIYEDFGMSLETRGSTDVVIMDMGAEGILYVVIESDVVFWVISDNRSDADSALSLLGF